MDSVRSWEVGVARSVICGYLYPKMVGLWERIAGVRIFDTRLRRVRSWSGISCRRCTENGARDRWRRVALPSFIATEYNG